MSETPVVVQKFGGTSVATPEGRAAVRDRVADALARGRRIVVVVSAMGRSGAPYATDTLLSLLDGFEPDARERDLLASCGEIVSAVVLAHELRAASVPAVALTGREAGIITDGCFRHARVVSVRPEILFEQLAEGRVPVVAGFQGISENGQVTTLGRGGSDTTACVIGAALSAECVEIYTDVEGVMTADPAALDCARVIDKVEYQDLVQMAVHGSRVLHPEAAASAMCAGVPLRIRGTFSAKLGTLVTTEPVVRDVSHVATAVSHVDDVVRFIAHLPEEDRASAMTGVFEAMAEAGVSLDMFTPFDTALAFSVLSVALDKARYVLTEMGLDFECREGLATVTLVGARMHGRPGVMARVAEALQAAGVEILQIADTHTMISLLVEQSKSRAAIAALHTAFRLGE